LGRWLAILLRPLPGVIGDSADLAWVDGRPPTYRVEAEDRPLGSHGCFSNWSSGSEVLEQRAYAYAALVEDFERVVDEVGGAEVTLRGLHG
jgi:hypothetical protein